jgi:hypothetical protein
LTADSSAAAKLHPVSEVVQPDDFESLCSVSGTSLISSTSGSVSSKPPARSGELEQHSAAVGQVQSEEMESCLVVPNTHQEHAVQGVSDLDWKRLKSVKGMHRKPQTSFDVSQFVILKLQPYGKEKLSPVSALLTSAWCCDINISYKDYFFGSGFRSCVFLDGQLVGDAVDNSILKSQCAAAQLALDWLSTVSPTIIIKNLLQCKSVKDVITPAQVKSTKFSLRNIYDNYEKDYSFQVSYPASAAARYKCTLYK